MEVRRPTGHAVRRSRAEFVVHIERCLRAAVDHDDYRLLPPYLIEKDAAGTGIRIARERAKDFRRRLQGLGLTLPGRGRPGPNMLTAMLGEVLEADPDAPMDRVIELLRRLFPDRIEIEPGVRVRWRPALPTAENALDNWDREKPWRDFQLSVSRARAVAQAERDSWP